MQYIEKNDVGSIFEKIKVVLDNKKDKLPNYSEEKDSCENYIGALNRVKLDYYKDIFDKASFLFISINKGHYFSNGNKRLSLYTALFFLFINNFGLVRYSKQKYENKLKAIFPEYKNYKQYKEFNPINYAYYNLTLIIAESNVLNISSDELKMRLKEFLKFSLEKYN